MCPFREKTPERRTDIVNKSRYQDYKQELREDFNTRCGYCNDHEGLRNTFYEIDHFIPKILLKKNEYADYTNLVFSCRYCNNSKRKKWPTNDRDKCNDGKIGFIDPCNKNYDSQFTRNSIGKIIPQSELGKWMHTELKLYLSRHSILWQIEKIENILKKFRELSLDKNDDYKELFIRMSNYFFDKIQKLKEENVK
ncbi:HNH nuclease domain-containing protein [Candidatus Magnetomoraceae bacterium gMMP-1]